MTKEPWRWMNDNTLVGDHGHRPVVLCARELSERKDDGRLGPFTTSGGNGQRIVACVNALAGYRPEALAGLVKAAEKICNPRGAVCMTDAISISELRAALAAFKVQA